VVARSRGWLGWLVSHCLGGLNTESACLGGVVVATLIIAAWESGVMSRVTMHSRSLPQAEAREGSYLTQRGRDRRPERVSVTALRAFIDSVDAQVWRVPLGPILGG
jgi:hypothetical protein